MEGTYHTGEGGLKPCCEAAYVAESREEGTRDPLQHLTVLLLTMTQYTPHLFLKSIQILRESEN